jgi:prepilin-type N-terminal cleavage/methylation domain-containing protein
MRHRQTNNRQSGFTLVEIAIVLVIIGLLLGGILKGQEMIVQAKIKNTISDYNGVLAAYNGYIDRYRALPGDDAGANTRWSLTNANGNGDGVINGAYNAATATPEPESRLFWQHLRQAGFIPGTGAQQPTNAHNGIVGVQTGDGPAPGGTVGPIWGTAGTPPINGLGGVLICASQVPDKVAIAVDNQTDDGLSNNGQVRALQISGNAAVTGSTVAANYQEAGGTNLYVVCRAI